MHVVVLADVNMVLAEPLLASIALIGASVACKHATLAAFADYGVIVSRTAFVTFHGMMHRGTYNDQRNHAGMIWVGVATWASSSPATLVAFTYRSDAILARLHVLTASAIHAGAAGAKLALAFIAQRRVFVVAFLAANVADVIIVPVPHDGMRGRTYKGSGDVDCPFHTHEAQLQLNGLDSIQQFHRVPHVLLGLLRSKQFDCITGVV